ncbi:chemotaxis protein [Salinigranum rubrum]|uniref:Chemotaxis protein n=1 Tax=Salinigranum rubrum TaxID=755307 RepID=A0A2I8VFP3_9EURY|nr:HAMP domain-containing methyl-accepting chemotaxis protein [Salinigranum rubrum]AUV80752.1 chemotaxis protein [Salinigranum rubrum]
MIEKIKIDGVNLGPKLILAFVLVALLVGVTGFVGYQGVTTIDEEAHLIAEDGLKMDHSAEMVIAIEQQRAAVQAAQLGKPGAHEEFNTASEKFTEEAQGLAGTHLSETQEEQLATIRTQHDEYDRLAEEFFEAQAAGETERAAQTAAEMDALRTEMESEAHAIEASAQSDLETQVAVADRTARQTQLEILGLTVGAFVAAIGIGLFVSRRITRPVERLSECAVAISQGDLDATVDDHVEDDEIGQMVEAFNEMQRNLQGLFGELERISRNVQTGELNQEVETDYPGTYGDVMGSLEAGVKQLSAGFDQISAASEDLERGDLDQTLDTDAPGTYGRVLVNLQNGIDQLSASLTTVQRVADEVAASSEEVTASVEEIEIASEEVAGSVEEVSQGAEEQNENLQRISEEMTELSATVEEIAASTDEVTDTASTAVERGIEGKEYASEATSEIQAMEAQAKEAASRVAALETEMGEIGAVVDIITDIAEQTNLLALNASIEAARVGEAGEGFAVVADEIKELAGEAARETSDIERRINEVQSTTSETVDGIREMTARVESGSETIENAVAMFDEISDAIENAESGIQEINDATGDQAASAEEVVAMVGEVASASDQAAAEASNVSAATEEQAASLSEASTTIKRVSALADDLHDQVSKFEVRAEASPTTPESGPIESASPSGDTSTASARADGGVDASR